MPVLPLDGGHLAQTGLEAVLRRPALREMAIASLVVTIGVAVVMAVTGHTGFVIFIGVPADRPVPARCRRRHASRASRRPTAPGVNDGVHAGRATVAVAAGLPGGARRRQPHRAEQVLLDDLTRDADRQQRRRALAPPYDAPLEALQLVVETLPDATCPTATPTAQRVLAEVLHRHRARHARAASTPPQLRPPSHTAARRCWWPERRRGWATRPTPCCGCARRERRRRRAVRRASVRSSPGCSTSPPSSQALRADPAFQATRAGLG